MPKKSPGVIFQVREYLFPYSGFRAVKGGAPTNDKKKDSLRYPLH